jgi:hypothetical protein
MKKSILLGYLILALSMLKAQSVWEGGLFIGTAGYSGDINPTLTPRFQDFTPSISLLARSNVSNRLGFRVGATYFRLKGDDSNFVGRESRDFNFSTNLFEFSLLGEWEPLGSSRYYTDAAGRINMDRLVSPYLFTGVGLIGGVLNTNFSNYPGDDKNIKAGIQKDRAYGNSVLGVCVPIGLGMKFDVSNTLTMALEGCIRASFSDYLDGISFSASPDANDIFMNLGAVVYYRFGSPKMKYRY